MQDTEGFRVGQGCKVDELVRDNYFDSVPEGTRKKRTQENERCDVIEGVHVHRADAVS